jgi:hypothetical protein
MRLPFCLFVSMCTTSLVTGQDPLEIELAALLKSVTDVTGYAVSLGYIGSRLDLVLCVCRSRFCEYHGVMVCADSTGRDFGIAAGQRDPHGFPKSIGGNASGTDRFLFGSGTKPFTATAIIRLQEQGLIKSLDDAASIYADPVLADLKPGTSLVGMLGARAGKVTVAHLIQMQSGIADFDVPGFDNQVLTSDSFDPLGMVEFLSTLNDTVCPADRMGNCACRFMCEPGTCTSYSSTNYVLAGLVLAGATGRYGPKGPIWASFDTTAFNKALGLDTNPAFKDSHFSFPVGGVLNTEGLSVGGFSVRRACGTHLSSNQKIRVAACASVPVYNDSRGQSPFRTTYCTMHNICVQHAAVYPCTTTVVVSCYGR